LKQSFLYTYFPGLSQKYIIKLWLYFICHIFFNCSELSSSFSKICDRFQIGGCAAVQDGDRKNNYRCSYVTGESRNIDKSELWNFAITKITVLLWYQYQLVFMAQKQGQLHQPTNNGWPVEEPYIITEKILTTITSYTTSQIQ
jgi:hypothetical protein